MFTTKYFVNGYSKLSLVDTLSIRTSCFLYFPLMCLGFEWQFGSFVITIADILSHIIMIGLSIWGTTNKFLKNSLWYRASLIAILIIYSGLSNTFLLHTFPRIFSTSRPKNEIISRFSGINTTLVIWVRISN